MVHNRLNKILPFQAKYFAYELTKQSPSNSLQKLAGVMLDAQVDINPHQVDAALFAFRSPLSKGAILADEVGLGKTIEAGLVIAQKWAERKRKILIITPANLRKQWSQELQDKFFLESMILEKSSFDSSINNGNLNPFNQMQIIICSYQFASLKSPYLKQINWDLVVIDEAHRLRNVYKPNNKTAIKIKDALDHAPKILLTATPLQNSLLELYGLVSVIDDYAFGDLKSFKAQYSKLDNQTVFDDLKTRLQPLCKRALRRQVLEYIKYTNRIALVEEYFPTENETLLYSKVSEYLQQEHLNALPASQRQLMTLILRKLLASSSFAVSSTFENLANRLEQQLTNHINCLELVQSDIGQNFETLDEMVDEWEEDERALPEADLLTEVQILSIRNEVIELRQLESLAKSIQQNSKGEKLITALDKGFSELNRLGALSKAIIFTESRRTQDYLFELLSQYGYADKIVLFNGTNTDIQSRKIYNEWFKKYQYTDLVTGSKTADMRAALVDCFKNHAMIMIATEAAAEGINLQFCSLVVNYDMPWNPQRIEQRIGRCHRYGQKHDVVVLNFLNKSNAADQRVYELLDQKFKLFSGVFGASDEVLGSIGSGIDFEKRIAKIYQECRTPQDIDRAFSVLRQEMELDIDETMQTTRKQLLENFDVQVHDKLRINLEQSTAYINQYENWLWQITNFALAKKAQFNDNYEFELFDNHNLENAELVRYKITKDHSDSVQHYRISHPLAEQVIEHCKTLIVENCSVVFNYSNQPKKISMVEEIIGCSGIMQAKHLTIDSFERQEFILLRGIAENGVVLDHEVCQQILTNLEAMHTKIEQMQVYNSLELLFDNDILQITSESAKLNNQYFDEETEKLDKWADDLKLSLEKQIKDLDAEIKLRKAEAKKLSDLEAKLKEQRVIKELEKKRSEKRRDLFDAQDEVDNRKESFLNDVESRLKQSTTIKDIFRVGFRIE